jgi:hypothetical protein
MPIKGEFLTILKINNLYIEKLIIDSLSNWVAPRVMAEVSELVSGKTSDMELQRVMKEYSSLLTYVFFEGKIHVAVFHTEDVE